MNLNDEEEAFYKWVRHGLILLAKDSADRDEFDRKVRPIGKTLVVHGANKDDGSFRRHARHLFAIQKEVQKA